MRKSCLRKIIVENEKIFRNKQEQGHFSGGGGKAKHYVGEVRIMSNFGYFLCSLFIGLLKRTELSPDAPNFTHTEPYPTSSASTAAAAALHRHNRTTNT